MPETENIVNVLFCVVSFDLLYKSSRYNEQFIASARLSVGMNEKSIVEEFISVSFTGSDNEISG